MSSLTGSAPDRTFSGDFGAFPREVTNHLLGPAPAASARSRTFRAENPQQWPKDRTGLEYFHRGIGRMLWERGGDAQAAASIQRDLEDGQIQAVLIDDYNGREYPIPRELWRAAVVSAEMYWTGRTILTADGRREGEIYIPASFAPVAEQTARAGRACELWLAEQVKASPDRRPKSRGEYESEATNRFDGLSGRSFRRAWTAATTGTAWSEGGRPRKPSH